MKALVATLNKMELIHGDKVLERYFTPETLNQLSETAIGKPITLGFNGITLGKVTKSWVDDSGCWIEFEGETLNRKHIVPGFKTTTTKNNQFILVRCLDFALVDNPVDKTLLTIEECNKE